MVVGGSEEGLGRMFEAGTWARRWVARAQNGRRGAMRRVEMCIVRMWATTIAGRVAVW